MWGGPRITWVSNGVAELSAWRMEGAEASAMPMTPRGPSPALDRYKEPMQQAAATKKHPCCALCIMACTSAPYVLEPVPRQAVGS